MASSLPPTEGIAQELPGQNNKGPDTGLITETPLIEQQGLGLIFNQGNDGGNSEIKELGKRENPIISWREEGNTEIVYRWMSKAELKSLKETGLVRGGRDGTHYVTDAPNNDALRARQRSALPQTPEVLVKLEVPKGIFSKPSKVDEAFNMPGGGIERTAMGNIPAHILEVRE